MPVALTKVFVVEALGVVKVTKWPVEVGLKGQGSVPVTTEYVVA